MQNQHEQTSIHDTLARQLRDVGHTMRSIAEGRGSQKRILMIIQRAGVITQSELTEHLGIQYGSASEVIGKLEAADLILRMPSETDRRTTDIRLTPAGEQAAHAARAERAKRHEEMFTCLNDEEKTALAALLEKLNASWAQQYGRPLPRGASSRRRARAMDKDARE